MPRYRVYPYMTISTVREVDADSPSDAIDEALQDIGSVMFLDHTFPDEGEWDADEALVEELDSDV